MDGLAIADVLCDYIHFLFVLRDWFGYLGSAARSKHGEGNAHPITHTSRDTIMAKVAAEALGPTWAAEEADVLFAESEDANVFSSSLTQPVMPVRAAGQATLL